MQERERKKRKTKQKKSFFHHGGINLYCVCTPVTWARQIKPGQMSINHSGCVIGRCRPFLFQVLSNIIKSWYDIELLLSRSLGWMSEHQIMWNAFLLLLFLIPLRYRRLWVFLYTHFVYFFYCLPDFEKAYQIEAPKRLNVRKQKAYCLPPTWMHEWVQMKFASVYTRNIHVEGESWRVWIWKSVKISIFNSCRNKCLAIRTKTVAVTGRELTELYREILTYFSQFIAQ